MVGQMVYSSKGTKIGSISSVSTDAQGQQQAVVGVERYLGLGGKNVLFPISSLKTRSKGGLTTTLRIGLISAGFLWLGFVIPTMVVNYAFHGARQSLTVIDGGHWLGVLLIQGAIMGWWGVR